MKQTQAGSIWKLAPECTCGRDIADDSEMIGEFMFSCAILLEKTQPQNRTDPRMRDSAEHILSSV